MVPFCCLFSSGADSACRAPARGDGEGDWEAFLSWGEGEGEGVEGGFLSSGERAGLGRLCGEDGEAVGRGASAPLRPFSSFSLQR